MPNVSLISPILRVGRFVQAFIALAVALPIAAQLGFPRNGRPNIILIVADDLAPTDLGAYGQSEVRTPYIDSLAAGGARFTDAYAGSPHEAASRSSIMTGHHGGHGAIRGELQAPLAPGDITLGEVLRSVGYRCVALGKWGLGWEGTTGHPRQQGFEEWLGYLEARDALNPYPTRLWRNEEPYTPWDNRSGLAIVHAEDLFVAATTNIMRFNPDRPFFTYHASNLPRSREPRSKAGPGSIRSGRYSQKPWPNAERLKAEAISRLDDSVGLILAGLASYNLLSSTVVILTSDQPPTPTNALRIASTQSPLPTPTPASLDPLSESALRVPLIVWWPGIIRPGTTVTHPVAHWDLLPTLADIGRTSRPGSLNGSSLLPLLLGNTSTNPPRPLYWEFNAPPGPRACRSNEWKLVLSDTNTPPKLFNLLSDPVATNNLADLHPEITLALTEFINSASHPWTPPTVAPPVPPWHSGTNALPARP